MQIDRLPIAIRFLRFLPAEADLLESTLSAAENRPYRYTRLPEGSLQDPDLYLANGDELKTVAIVSDLRPGDVRPVLVIGKPGVALPYVCIERPIRWNELFNTLDRLIARSRKVLSALKAGQTVIVPERRRRERFDLDMSDPTKYEKMRTRPLEQGSVLVIDKSPALHNHLTETLRGRNVTVDWTDNAHYAVGLCERQPVSLVMINTSMPDLDPYWLCKEIRRFREVGPTAVIYLIDKTFEYDGERTRVVGCDGFLTKPLMPPQILAILGRFLRWAR